MKRLLILLLLTGCAPKAAEEDPKPTALVTTEAAARGEVEESLTAYGAAEFMPQAEHGLTAPIEAVVTRIAAPPGTLVSAGQPIVILTASPATRAETAKADHDAELAEAAFGRAERLRATGLDSDADVEAARAAASAAAETRQAMRVRTGPALVLRAPIAGIVESVALAPGDMAVLGANLAKIGDPSALRVRLGVEPASIGAVRAGDIVRLGPVAGGTRTTGAVMAVDPRADAQTKLASVSVSLRAGGGLSPGAPLRGVIVLGRRSDAVLIPRAAVLYDQDRPYVFAASGAIARKVNVTLGADQGDRVEVTRGLDAGARVVVEGAAALDDGMAIREAPAAGPPA